jgi:hypothetical protein
MDNDDPIYEAAKRDLEQHKAECRRLEEWLARYEDYRLRLVPAALLESDQPEPRKSAAAGTVISAVHDILEKRKDALTLSAIFTALCARGVVIGGKHPKQNLSQKLHACPDLKSYGKRGWYFADTVPPCLRANVRLDDDELEYEEGPDTEVSRPLQSNGAADLHSA